MRARIHFIRFNFFIAFLCKIRECLCSPVVFSAHSVPSAWLKINKQNVAFEVNKRKCWVSCEWEAPDECVSHGNSANQAAGTHCDDVLINCAIDNDCAERKWFEKIIKVFVNARTHQWCWSFAVTTSTTKESATQSPSATYDSQFADEIPLEMLVNLWLGVDCVTVLRRHSQITYLWRKVKVNEEILDFDYFGLSRGTQPMLTVLCFFFIYRVFDVFFYRDFSTFPQNRSEQLSFPIHARAKGPEVLKVVPFTMHFSLCRQSAHGSAIKFICFESNEKQDKNRALL